MSCIHASHANLKTITLVAKENEVNGDPPMFVIIDYINYYYIVKKKRCLNGEVMVLLGQE